MIIKSRIMEQASGSLGSITGENGRGGLSLKDKPPPRGTPNAKARIFTNNIKIIGEHWRTMPAPAKARWEGFAGFNPTIDKLGNIIPQSAWNWFYSTASRTLNAKKDITRFVSTGAYPTKLYELKGLVLTTIINGYRLTFEENFKDYAIILWYGGKSLGKGEQVFSGKYTFIAALDTNYHFNHFDILNYPGLSKHTPMKFIIITNNGNNYKPLEIILPPRLN